MAVDYGELGIIAYLSEIEILLHHDYLIDIGSDDKTDLAVLDALFNVPDGFLLSHIIYVCIHKPHTV